MWLIVRVEDFKEQNTKEDLYEKYTVKKGELFLENIARIYNICKTRQERKHGI